MSMLKRIFLADLSTRNLAGILVLGVAGALLFMSPHLWWDMVSFYVFQTRDLLRAQNLLDGQMIFWGPEMTGGGTLPGPFYYFLLGVSQLFARGWQSAWIWLAILNCLGCVLGFLALRAAGLSAAAYFWLAAFALAPKTAFFATEFYNVSYMSVFVIAALICAQIALLHPSPHRRRSATLALFSVCGLAIQLHFTAIVIPLGFCSAYFWRRRLHLQPTGMSTIGLGWILFCLPLLPYLVWLLARQFGFELGQKFEYVGDSLDAPRKMLSLVFERNGRLAFDSLLWELKMFVPPVFPPLAIAWFCSRSKSGAEPPAFSNLGPMAMVCLFALIPVLDQLISPQAFRYGMPFYIGLLALSALLFERLLRARDPRSLSIFIASTLLYGLAVYVHDLDLARYFATLGVPLALLQIFAALVLAAVVVHAPEKLGFAAAALAFLAAIAVSRPMLASITYRPRPMPDLAQWKSIWRQFRAQSDLSYEQAVRRIYFVNHHKEQDPEPVFRMVSSEGQTKSEARPPGGFFVSAFFPGGNVREWLLAQKLQDDVRSALHKGALRLRLGEPILPKGPIVVGYDVLAPDFPPYIQNTGEGYSRTADDAILDALEAPAGSARMANGDLLFKWNLCANRAAYCSSGAVVRLEQSGPNRHAIRVHVIGSAISQSSPWIHPEWTEAWIEPYLEVECGGQKRRLPLLSSIGYRREYGLGVIRTMGANHSVIAPYDQEFSVECAHKLRRVTMGRKASAVEQIDRILTLPAPELSVDLQ